MGMIRVIVTGACGRMGKEVVKALSKESDMQLVGAVDVVSVDADIGEVAGIGKNNIKVASDLQTVIDSTEPYVMVDFTNPKVVMDNIRVAIKSDVSPVVGTTGIEGLMLEEIKILAERYGVGVVVAPNFSIGAVLMMKFASEAFKYMPHAEIIELHHDKKLDAPSGTALRTGELMLEGQRPGTRDQGPELIEKLKNVRGGNLEGIRVHSIRLPGLVAHQEVIFGDIGQTLTIRHDSLSRESFMPGVIWAIRKVREIKGVVYGLENLLG